ncbi:MAG: hypothetical protein GX552_04725 [Chloroflexi bacterium]|jgi:hypothetical protein|nr:hypothetical protein [Chloroflexota bacterium]
MTWTPEADELERALRARRAPTLFAPDIAKEFVLPAYDGYSLANVGPTVGTILEASAPYSSPPLASQYWQGLSDGVQRVIVVVLDALGYLQLGQIIEEQPDSIWARLARRGILLPMTSISPSTTTTALASLTTGATPLAHGMLGYELWLREYGVLVEMLSVRPVFGAVESLMEWGFLPEAFLARPSLGELWAQAGVRSTAFVPTKYTRSTLSRTCYRGFSQVRGYTDVADMWQEACHALAEEVGERNVYFIYWAGIDSAIHRHGTSGGFWQAELDSVAHAFEDQFLDFCAEHPKPGTLLVVLADHGFVDSPIEAAHDVDADRVFRRRMLIPFSGESRAAYLHALDAGSERTLQEVRETLGPDYVVHYSQDVIDAGLFGTGEPAPESRARVGHLYVAARGLHYLDRQNKRFKIRGRHGGLSPEEMLIPWLAVRLDR